MTPSSSNFKDYAVQNKMSYTNIKRISVACFFLLMSSCVYLPETMTETEISCELFTKELVLSHKNRATVAFGNVDFKNCSGEACIGLLLMASTVPITTYIVSGSIVVLANSIHWMEKEGKCDDSFLKEKARDFVLYITPSN